jgi:hypothetical protein
MKNVFYRFNQNGDYDLLDDNNNEQGSHRSPSCDSIQSIMSCEEREMTYPEDASDKGLLLIEAIKEEIVDLDKINAFIEAGADLNVTDLFGNTALTMAAEKGHIDVVKALTHPGLPRPANVNYVNPLSRLDYNTAITAAIAHDHVAVVSHLGALDARIDFNIWPMASVSSAKMKVIIEKIQVRQFYQALKDGSTVEYDAIVKQYGKAYTGAISPELVFKRMMGVVKAQSKDDQMDTLNHALHAVEKQYMFGKRLEGENALSQYVLNHHLRDAVEAQKAIVLAQRASPM